MLLSRVDGDAPRGGTHFPEQPPPVRLQSIQGMQLRLEQWLLLRAMGGVSIIGDQRVQKLKLRKLVM